VISSCLEALATGIDALFFPVTWVNLGGAGFWEGTMVWERYRLGKGGNRKVRMEDRAGLRRGKEAQAIGLAIR
jgi:hypothetical protein